MSAKVTLRQPREQLPAVIDHTVKTGEECVVQRNGKDYAVIVSAREWKRRNGSNERVRSTGTALRNTSAEARAVGKKLDALGPEYRLARSQQTRIEVLLEKKRATRLSRDEERELKSILQEADAVMRRRARAITKVA